MSYLLNGELGRQPGLDISTLTSHFGGLNSIYLSMYLFYCSLLKTHLKQGSQASRIDRETRISTSSHTHTPHLVHLVILYLVFLKLRRQRQPSCPANVVYINGQGAGTRKFFCRQHIFPVCELVEMRVSRSMREA